MSSRPVVAAIIVTYNGSRWVGSCFSSFRSSDYPCKVYVVDNNSSDDTVAKISANFPEVHVIKNSMNAGFGEANNQAIQRALMDGADYFFLLNQDAWIEPNTISELVKAFQRTTDYGIVSPLHYTATGDRLDFAFRGYLSKTFEPDKLLQDKSNTVREVDFINAAAWMVSRVGLEKAGGFGYLFPHYGEDRDLVQRMRYHHLRLGFVTSCRIFHDRPDRRFDFRSSERMTWYYSVGTRVRLSDINRSFTSTYFSVLLWFSRDMILHTFRGKFIAPGVFFAILSTIFIGSRKKIADYRKKISDGASFLFLS